MRYWYYKESEREKGPIRENELAKLFEDGSLPPETLVRTESIGNWQEARTIKELVPPSPASPTPSVTSAMAPLPISDFVPSGPQVRPWVRWWARMMDDALFGLVMLLLTFVYPRASETNDVIIGVVFSFAYIFVEAFMLSAWGTTPGKALLNVRLRRVDGTIPNYFGALSRSFNVWVRGLGCGIGLVAVIAEGISHRKLVKDGITPWDKSGGFRVAHKSVERGRIITYVFVNLGIVGLFLLAMFLPSA
jgi:hypothetical protein